MLPLKEWLGPEVSRQAGRLISKGQGGLLSAEPREKLAAEAAPTGLALDRRSERRPQASALAG
jgi:hypothetical protein